VDGDILMDGGDTVWEGLGKQVKQRTLVQAGQKTRFDVIWRRLVPQDAALAHSAAGPGANGWMGFPLEDEASMANVLWRTATRRRIGCGDAHKDRDDVPYLVCQNCSVDGTRICGEPLDQWGKRACICLLGGSVLVRHTALNRTGGGLITRWEGVTREYEQRVPAWGQG
jgi:hypothetical protein